MLAWTRHDNVDSHTCFLRAGDMLKSCACGQVGTFCAVQTFGVRSGKYNMPHGSIELWRRPTLWAVT